jgi:hypothetical protein
MPTVMIILNVVLVIGVLAVLVGTHLYAIATQHRDHGAAASGPFLSRRVWSARRRRSRAVKVDRRGRSREPWPAA